tara:strand:+ start:1379 stop:2365 length:987 start_codon:yes stop_codon:yes gene_type:complete
MSFNVGIIGLGKMGRIRYEILKKHKKINKIFCYDSSYKQNFNNDIKNVDQIFKNKEIDLIFICTPNYLNKKLTIKSLKNNKHTFCEKPPSFNSDEMKEIINIEKKSKKILMYGFNHRHHESIKQIKKIIESKKYGNILWMRGRYGKSVDKTFYKDWRSKKKLSGGGILIDQGIHLLDLFLYFVGDFNKVYASVSNLYWDVDVEDNVFAILENSKKGIAVSLHSTITQWRHLFSLEIFLEKGYMVLNGLKTSSNTYGTEKLTIAKSRSTAPSATWKDEKNITFKLDNSWKNEIKMFINAVEKNSMPEIGNSADGLKIMQIVDRIYEYKK